MTGTCQEAERVLELADERIATEGTARMGTAPYRVANWRILQDIAQRHAPISGAERLPPDRQGQIRTVRRLSRINGDCPDLVDLIDDRDRRFHIELIFPDQEPDQAADWKHWSGYKAKNRERFERIDAELLTEHTRIAEEWE